MDVANQGLLTCNIDLLTQDQWEELYPRSSYNERKDFALHFLIAMEQPTLTNYTQTLKEKNPARLIQADPQNYDLTPLHLAAMKGRLAVAEILLKTCATDCDRKKMINTPDALGWTPLHHAAVTSASLFQYFILLGGDPSKKTTKRGDCEDLRELTGRLGNIRSSETLFVKNSENGKLSLLSDLTETAKEKIFGKNFIFTDSPLFLKKHFVQLWINDGSNQYEGDYALISKQYEAFRSKRVPLLIDQCEELRDFSLRILDCKAKETIFSGSVITEYSGINQEEAFCKSFVDAFTEKEIFSSEYLFENINGRNWGNEARFINAGFPNAIFISTNLRGCKRHVLFALRDIQPGESILWDYGIKMFHLSFGKSKLLGKNEMLSYYQNNNNNFFELFNNSLKNYSKNKTIENFIKLIKSQSSLTYVLNSPASLLYLHFSESVKYSVWENAFNTEYHCKGWRQINSAEFYYLKCIFETLGKLENICINDEINKIINQWVLKQIEKQSVINIMKGLDLLCERGEGVTPHELKLKLSGFLIEINEFLKGYDWKMDSNHTFSLERRAKLLEAHYKTFPRDMIKSELNKYLETLPQDSEAYEINKLVLNIL
ncbi:MAG: ankyrin repeat domain-containing protein [Candidatus Protochlamydia sp.]|nr:ankyrin repeat domain-containing protein [Candidatus Protochlamydia sp.]